MRLCVDPNNLNDYRTFLRVKGLPSFRCAGRELSFPDEYAHLIDSNAPPETKSKPYKPFAGMFDYQRDITGLAIRKRKFAVFADCLAGESVINSPDGNIRIDEAYRQGRPVRVYAIANNGSVVVAEASAPFVAGINRLYRFRFESGRDIIATLGHRFLSASGWRCGGSLKPGERLLVSDVSRLRSILESGQQGYAEDDRRLRKTLQGYPGDCSPCHYPCGERLRQEEGSGPTLVPSPGDARAPARQMSHKDGPASKQECNHRHRDIFRLSTHDLVVPVANVAESVVCQLHAFGQACIAANTQTYRQVREDTNLAKRIGELHPLATRRNEDDHFLSCQPCDNSLVVFDTLAAIDYIRTDVYYDIEVPGLANFLANGVWSHNCGLGKTRILLEFIRHAANVLPKAKRLLIVSPLMVIRQTLAEAAEWYGEQPIEQIHAAGLPDWLQGAGNARIAITNFDGLTDELKQGRLGCLVIDESSCLKSHYGKWGSDLLRLGDGLGWKLCLTGTPAPNDRIEYANHAVFLDAYPTINAFLARFFINRGQTQERWVLKPHAIAAFYRALSHWSIFLANPETYGWKDNAGKIPPIVTHIHNVAMTDSQSRAVYDATGQMFVTHAGGIVKRSRLAQIGKGTGDIESLKPAFIRSLVDSWPNESTIIWCLYNEEQDRLASLLPDAANIDGSTPMAKRETLIDDFKAGRRKVLISKPRVLGYGLNLQVATRQVFSGLQDSYESYYQAVKRSNRVGSTRPLNVHIPVTEIEVPMIESVLAKAHRVQQDTNEQEMLFKSMMADGLLSFN